MQRFSRFIKFLIVASFCGGIYLFFWYKNQQKTLLFIASKPYKTTIKQVVHAVGSLELKDTIKVGSLVAGTILNIAVAENNKVTKGQLLAVIDNGKSDTEVKEAQGALDHARAQLTFQKASFARQEQLFKNDFISAQDFDAATQQLNAAAADVYAAEALLEKKTIEFNNLNVLAPIDGTVVAVGITKGMRITTDLDATVLFELAHDFNTMHGILEIDESDIGTIHLHQKVSLFVESYPHRVFKGNIIDVRYSPKAKGGILYYQATVKVDNSEQLLRPGMSIQARINVAKETDALALTSQAFTINNEKLVKIAQQHQMDVCALDAGAKKKITKEHRNEHLQFVWMVDGNSFKEVPVVIGITDDVYFGVRHGLAEHDQIVTGFNQAKRRRRIAPFAE